ncbi:MAG TPA: hypothetical protein VM425_15925 [Myxococcota bacterium]|nr:hypothetical protein [Myxococcota bacterium]
MRRTVKFRRRALAARAASESGRVNLLTVLLILIVLGAVYFTIMLAPPYIEYYKLDEKVRAVANMSHREKDEEVLLENLRREAKILELNLPHDAFKIKSDPQGKWIEISLSYARLVELVPFNQQLTLHFDIDVVENF